MVIPFEQNQDFTGREDILEDIGQGFFQLRSLRRMALAGLGGIG